MRYLNGSVGCVVVADGWSLDEVFVAGGVSSPDCLTPRKGSRTQGVWVGMTPQYPVGFKDYTRCGLGGL